MLQVTRNQSDVKKTCVKYTTCLTGGHTYSTACSVSATYIIMSLMLRACREYQQQRRWSTWRHMQVVTISDVTVVARSKVIDVCVRCSDAHVLKRNLYQKHWHKHYQLTGIINETMALNMKYSSILHNTGSGNLWSKTMALLFRKGQQLDAYCFQNNRGRAYDEHWFALCCDVMALKATGRPK